MYTSSALLNKILLYRVINTLPYLIQEAEADLNPQMQDSSYSPHRQTPTTAITECEEARYMRALDVQNAVTVMSC